MERATFTRLEQLPNVGPAIAAKLRLIGVCAPADLIGRDPHILFEELSARTGQRHDPCLLDVFISAVRFMDGEPERPWWRGTRGEWYVVAQVVIFAFILIGPRSAAGLPSWTEPYATAATVVGAALMAAGATLSLWGVFALGTNLSVLPYPKEDSMFVESGPYRVVRNPIYGGLILGSFGLALVLHSWLGLLYALALLVLFDLKTRREERWLRERYPAYADYQRRVRKLLPWVW